MLAKRLQTCYPRIKAKQTHTFIADIPNSANSAILLLCARRMIRQTYSANACEARTLSGTCFLRFSSVGKCELQVRSDMPTTRARPLSLIDTRESSGEKYSGGHVQGDSCHFATGCVRSAILCGEKSSVGKRWRLCRFQRVSTLYGSSPTFAPCVVFARDQQAFPLASSLANQNDIHILRASLISRRFHALPFPRC